ncbi:hypothetical protein ACFPFV_11650 [Salinicoccus siamensis]|uniref:Uncharacterized protein n=1 Tax=Salinicoccus siamensis TaxID=381830 RepID=A0ABV5Z5N7_9STAP
MDKDRISKLKSHFVKVNNCSEEDFEEYYKAVLSQKRKTSLETIKERVANYKETAITKEKSILDDTVLYRIEGNIPYKEEAIKQLTGKGLYRFYENEE